MRGEDRPTVLCVDDDAASRALVSRVLQKNGYRVLNASNVRSALDQVRRESVVDLILLDLNMPEHSGFDAIALLKVEPKFKEIPIIVVSNTADPGDREKALGMGAAEFVGYPVKDKAVIEAVRRVRPLDNEPQ